MVFLAVACAAPWTCRGEEAASRHDAVETGDVPFRNIFVNDKPISPRLLDAALKFRLAGVQVFHGTVSDLQRAELARDVEEKELIKELFLMDAEKKRLRTDGEEFLRYLDGEERRYGGKEKYRKFLKGAGLDDDVYRALMERNFLAERYIREIIAAGVVVSDTEVVARYDRNHWQYESPGKIRFHAYTFMITGGSLSPMEVASLRSFARSVGSEEGFRGEGERLIQELSARTTVERHMDMEWNQQRGGELWENLDRIPVGKTGIYEDQGKRYFLYFVKERIPGNSRMERGKAIEQVRKQLIDEKIYKGIHEKVQELKSSAQIRME